MRAVDGVRAVSDVDFRYVKSSAAKVILATGDGKQRLGHRTGSKSRVS